MNALSRRSQLVSRIASSTVLVAVALAACSDPGRTATEVDEGETPPVLLIGLDGADWRVMRPLLAKGRLPHLARLLESAATGPLRSKKPLRSPALWTTIATGKRREQHGIHDFLTNTSLWPADLVDADAAQRPVTSNMRRCKAIWNLASEAGRSVAVVGWLATWPAEEVRGWLVSSYVAFQDAGQYTSKGSVVAGVPDQTYPASFLAEIAPGLAAPAEITPDELAPVLQLPPPDDPVWSLRRRPGSDLGSGVGVTEKIVDSLRWSFATNTNYTRVAAQLLERERPDFTAVYLEGIDSVGHRFWAFQRGEEYLRRRLLACDFETELAPDLVRAFGEVMTNWYVYTDSLVGELLRAAGPGAVVCVVSDHGFGDFEDPDFRTGKSFSGQHRPDGILILAGPGVDSGVEVANARIEDVTPTLLHLLDIPVGKDMDGRVLPRPLRSLLAERPLRKVDSHEDGSREAGGAPIAAPGVDAALEERLRSLGYVGDDDLFTPEGD